MSDILKTGNIVKSEWNEYQVIRNLGEGGQGNVYLVKDVSKMYALKWYNQKSATPEQYKALEELIEIGIPHETYIWPLEIVEDESENNFGYVMPLIDEKKYQKLSYFFSGEIKVDDPKIIIDACLKMTSAFYELHAKGMCYRDISFGNLFVNFETGDVKICDNDNVTLDHLSAKEDIWGTGGFMAPELVRGDKAPSTETDLYSLSVVIFRMLHLQHPLEGQREYDIAITTYETDRQLYGENPIFIFDPIDETNRPVKGHKDIAMAYWQMYPNWFREVMIKAFTTGLHHPEERIRESKWIDYLSQLRGQLTYCYHCGESLYYDQDNIGDLKCPHCHKAIKILSPRMKIGKNVVMLNYDTLLMANQIYPKNMLAFDEVVGKVEVHPQHPEIWGLRNCSDQEWFYSTEEDEVRRISKNGVVPLKQNRQINFGEAVGQVRLSQEVKKTQNQSSEEA